MSQINSIIARFVNLLRESWLSIEEIELADATGTFKNDWKQALWELAVEGQLRRQVCDLRFLVPYGDGADVNGASSRILEPNGLPTHCVNCIPRGSASAFDFLNDSDVVFPSCGMTCDRFVTIGDDGWYYEKAPFDMVLTNGGEGEMVFRVSDLDMMVVPAETSPLKVID